MKRSQNKSNLSIVRDYLAGERPFTQVGWTDSLEPRKNGEMWIDARGIKWMQKNGYKHRISKELKIKPDDMRQRCSHCERDMKWGNHLDNKIFPKTGRCYECNIIYETKLKVEGKFENYEKLKILKNERGFCMDLKSKLEESLKYLESGNKLTFLNEDGTSESWSDTNVEKLLTDVKTDLADCNDALKRIESAIWKLENV